MKPLTSAILLVLGSLPVLAQTVDIPGNPMVTPKNFKTRAVGGGMDTGTKVDAPKEAKARYVTHVVLFEKRFWQNTEGKPLEAKLLAFEDLTAEGVKGGPPPAMPTPPAKPTVVRDGKIRLLVNQKPVLVALASLSTADQEFIRDIQASLTRKAAAAK